MISMSKPNIFAESIEEAINCSQLKLYLQIDDSHRKDYTSITSRFYHRDEKTTFQDYLDYVDSEKWKENLEILNFDVKKIGSRKNLGSRNNIFSNYLLLIDRIIKTIKDDYLHNGMAKIDFDNPSFSPARLKVPCSKATNSFS